MAGEGDQELMEIAEDAVDVQSVYDAGKIAHHPPKALRSHTPNVCGSYHSYTCT